MEIHHFEHGWITPAVSCPQAPTGPTAPPAQGQAHIPQQRRSALGGATWTYRDRSSRQ